ncbi:SH3 domain-containing protein [Flavobacterium sp.]|uniref:SH3 domain-containing protein n=1 Tax=Flavobacterium sp. TaxID=239 RepID=UPI00374CE05B
MIKIIKMFLEIMKIKKIAINTFLIFILLISCNMNAKDNFDLSKLKKAYLEKNDKEFIQNFPKNFENFKSVFGWNDSLDKAYPLYKDSTKYIDKFFEIISKDKTKKSLTLIVDIGLGGKYQADGVSYFKMNIEKLFIKNSNLSCELLKNRKLEDIDSFWLFYLDSPQPLTSVPDYLKKIKIDCDKVYFSLERQIKLIQKQNLVSEITTENKANKLKLINDFIPKGYIMLDSLSGYINTDKLLDKIIVLADIQEFKNNESRLFMILLNDSKNGYVLNLKNPNIIPCIKCTGGTGGEDSYSDLSYKENTLSFKQMKILDSKIVEIKYEFLNDRSDFKLNNVFITNSNLTEDLEYKVKIIVHDKISLKDFNYNLYGRYLKYYTKINDSDGYTNLREKKSSSSTILEKIKTEESVEVLDNSDDWLLVQSKTGKKGYIYKTKIKSE